MTHRTHTQPLPPGAPGASEPIYTVDNPPPVHSPADVAEMAWRRIPIYSKVLLGHLRPKFLERSPISLFGISDDTRAGGGKFYLYRDAAGARRVLRSDEHDRAGIASLFVGAEDWLCRLWPAADGGWDDWRACETLMHFSACIGVVSASRLGFELPPFNVA